MKYCSVCLLMLVLFMGVLVTQSSCTYPYSNYLHGQISYLDENYEAAIDFYNKAINQAPNYRDAYVGRGEVYYALKQYDAAIADYNRAIQLSPQGAAAIYVSRAEAYHAKNNYDQALEDCTTALELQPDYLGAYYRRSWVYTDLGEYDKAIASSAAARSLAPNDAHVNYRSALAYEVYGDALFKIDEYDKALSQYTLAISLYAFAYDAATSHPEAKDRTRFIARAQAGRARVCLLRAGIYLQRLDMDNALSDFSTTIQLDPANYVAFQLRGDLYYALERYREAIRDYTRLIELKPTNSVGYSLRGKAHLLAGDQASADADLAIAEQLSGTQ